MREMQWHLSFVCPLSALSGEYTAGWFFDLPSFRVPPVTKLCCGSSYWYCLSITYTLSLRGILIRIKRQQFSIPGPWTPHHLEHLHHILIFTRYSFNSVCIPDIEQYLNSVQYGFLQNVECCPCRVVWRGAWHGTSALISVLASSSRAPMIHQLAGMGSGAVSFRRCHWYWSSTWCEAQGCPIVNVVGCWSGSSSRWKSYLCLFCDFEY